MEKEDKYLTKKRDGKIPSIFIEADTLATGVREAILDCYSNGLLVKAPKHQEGGSLGIDADILIHISNPDGEPKVYNPAHVDSPRGDMQYILEVVYGIHNHWKKCEEHQDWWGYTYNERFNPQIPFILKRIKHDLEKKGRITGRDYQFSTWIAAEDIIVEQDDAPCWQTGQFRFIKGEDGKTKMNYLTHWRSRDLLKAWNQNCIAQIELMKVFAKKVSSVLGEEIELGSYIDHSNSLHLYGLYRDRDGLYDKLIEMRNILPDSVFGSLEFRFNEMSEMGSKQGLKRLIAAQSDAESKGHGLNQSVSRLKELGYNLESFPYPAEWDSWPKSWDEEPDITKLARVIKSN